MKRRVKLMKPILLACSLFLLQACSQQPSLPALTDIDGNPINTKGQWVILTYWASWCKNCRQEMPTLNQFAQENQGRAIVLGVNYDKVKNRQQLLNIIEALDVRFPTLASDPAPQIGLESVKVLPTTFVFNPEGKLAAKFVGGHAKNKLTNIIVQ